MKITICGSMKFAEKFVELKQELEAIGHDVLLPIAAPGVDYWAEDGTKKIEAKKELRLMETHFEKINASEAIIVANYTKGDIENYIGAATFIEMAYAKYQGKKVFVLNPLPDQKYINDEVVSWDPIVIHGDLSLIA